jgi:hypothetical protein
MADLLPDWASGILSAIQTDTGYDLSGLANSFLGGGSNTQPGGIVKSSFGVNVGGPGGITIGTPSFTGGGGGTSGGGGAGRDVGGSVMSYHLLGEKMRSKLGFRPKRKTVMYIIRTLGFVVASQILGLDVNDVLWLFMHKRHSSRRHFVQTMVKAVRRGDRFRRQLSKYGHHLPRAARAAPVRRRRRRA